MDKQKLWKTELYQIQLGAPKPKKIICTDANVDRPEWYGNEYHGVMGHREAAELLRNEPNGAYLVRLGHPDNEYCVLTWRFNNRVHHYKLYFDGLHHLRPLGKCYDSVGALVADGLVMLHMEMHARHILEMIVAQETKDIYTNSPYVTLNKKKLQSLSRLQLQQKHEDVLSKLSAVSLGDDGTARSTEALLERCGKPHAFRTHTFKGLNWCELCANFLWGFTAQGKKCEDCGFIAHNKCSERVPNHCVPDLKHLRGVFGVDLSTLLSAHASALPFVVSRCVSEIEARGMDGEGIYRVSGFADEIEALKMAFDKDGEAADLSVYSNINVIAGALKLYLRLLPVPLLTYEVHPHFVAVTNAKSVDERAEQLRDCLSHLPPAHYNCLQYVIEHLHRVSLREEVNKMSAHNLSTVFAPTLIATPPALTDLTLEIRALQALIQFAPIVYRSNE